MRLDEFASSFGKYGGGRSYLFKWIPEMKVGDSNSTVYKVKSTSLPESSIEEISIHWQGMASKLPGARTYADWTITVNCDNNWDIRQNFEDWMDLINNWYIDDETGDSAGKTSFASDRGDYLSTQRLQLLDYNLNVVKTVTLYQAWPKSVGSISLDYSAQEVASFDVTFSYLYYAITLR